MRRLFFALSAVLFTTAIFGQKGTVNVKITGIENTKGVIRVGIYNDKAAFPTFGQELQGKKIESTQKGDVNCTFKNLPDGTYAIAAWHDENSNEEIDKNFFGVPKESYGFSKNKYGTFGPPDFEEVSFRIVNGEVVDLTINLE